MPINIPEQLHNVNFRFIKVKAKEKIPVEKEWQNTNNYMYSQVELTKWLIDENNYGVACGYGGLIVVDSDTEELNKAMEKLPKTFVVKTGNPDINHRHHYFICPDCNGKVVITKDGKHYGEIQSKGSQVVGVGSTHPNGRLYLIYDDSGIAEIKFSQLKEAIKDLVSTDKFEQKIVVQPSATTKTIPRNIKDLIKNGCEEGQRNFSTWLIVKELYNLGYDVDIVLEKVEEFNSKCKPPRDINEVRKHVEQLLRRPQYLAEKISYEQLQKLLEEDILKNVEIEKQKKVLPVIWDRDLKNIQSNPDMNWYVFGFVPEKSIVMWAGKRASFKSWSALQLAVALASGKPLFNKFDTSKVSVLYIDEENGIETLKERISKIKIGMGITEDLDNLGYVSFEGLKIEREEWKSMVKDFLSEHTPCVIIVDSFRRIISTEENDATEVNKVFTECFRPIAQEFNATWILIHHLRKGVSGRASEDLMDELRGSSELTNYADVVLIFERPQKTQNRFIFRQAKCRRSKEQPPYMIEMKWSEDNSSLEFETIGTAEEILDSIDICSKKIMVWLEENNTIEFQTKDIQENMKKEGFASATINRSLGVLVSQGKLIRPKRGRYLRNVVSENQSYQDTNGGKI